jgi:hypothetical protein
MKREQLERANKIDSQIKELKALDALLVQANTGRNQLAAADVDCYDHFTIMKHCSIPPIILAKFRQVIADEVVKLDEEFEAL